MASRMNILGVLAAAILLPAALRADPPASPRPEATNPIPWNRSLQDLQKARDYEYQQALRSAIRLQDTLRQQPNNLRALQNCQADLEKDLERLRTATTAVQVRSTLDVLNGAIQVYSGAIKKASYSSYGVTPEDKNGSGTSSPPKTKGVREPASEPGKSRLTPTEKKTMTEPKGPVKASHKKSGESTEELEQRVRTLEQTHRPIRPAGSLPIEARSLVGTDPNRVVQQSAQAREKLGQIKQQLTGNTRDAKSVLETSRELTRILDQMSKPAR